MFAAFCLRTSKDSSVGEFELLDITIIALFSLVLF